MTAVDVVAGLASLSGGLTLVLYRHQYARYVVQWSRIVWRTQYDRVEERGVVVVTAIVGAGMALVGVMILAGKL